MSGSAVAAARCEITDPRTDCLHLVTDAEFAAGRQAGRYITVCEREVLAASMTAPEGSRCQDCKRREG